MDIEFEQTAEIFSMTFTAEQKQLEEIAILLGETAEKGSIIALTGDLGAGKTTFTKAFAKGMGIEEHITSPTFTIIQEYDGVLPLYHFDVYRIEDPLELEEVGCEEYFSGDGVTVVEWGDMIKDLLPEKTLWIILNTLDLTRRKVRIHGSIKGNGEWVKVLKSEGVKGS